MLYGVFVRMKIPELKTKEHKCSSDSSEQEIMYRAVLKEVIDRSFVLQ